jgi:hypothetical protein
MALLKVSEFAEKYNLKRTNIYTYRDRKKLTIIDGYIDTENPINKIFIESRETSSKVKVKPHEKPLYETTIPQTESVENTEQYKDTEKKTKRLTSRMEDPLYLEFKRSNDLKDEKLKEDIRLARIRNDKIEGRLIPVDIVKRSVSEIVSRYKMTFLQQTEQLIRDVLNELLASNEKITGTCSKLTDIANESSKRAVTETKATIQSIITESINSK